MRSPSRQRATTRDTRSQRPAARRRKQRRRGHESESSLSRPVDTATSPADVVQEPTRGSNLLGVASQIATSTLPGMGAMGATANMAATGRAEHHNGNQAESLEPESDEASTPSVGDHVADAHATTNETTDHETTFPSEHVATKSREGDVERETPAPGGSTPVTGLAKGAPSTATEHSAPLAGKPQPAMPGATPTQPVAEAETADSNGKGESVADEASENSVVSSVNISGDVSDPGDIITQLTNVPPTQALAAYQLAGTASATAFETQRQDVQDSMPEIQAPTGLPAVGSDEAKEQQAAAKAKAAKVAAGKDANAKFDGQLSGREVEQYDTSVETPESLSLPSTSIQGSESAEGGGDQEVAASAQRALNTVGFDTAGIPNSAGPRPAVDQTGDADPAQAEAFEMESNERVTSARSESESASRQDFGEHAVFPDPDDATIKPCHEITAVGPPEVESAQATTIAPEVQGGLDQSLAPPLQEGLTQQRAEYDQGKSEFDAGAVAARAESDQRIAELEDSTRQEQLEQQSEVQADVVGYRDEWQSEIDDVDMAYQSKVDTESAATRTEIQTVRTTKESEAAGHLGKAEKDAAAERKKSELEAARKKQEAEQESDGFWGWVKSKAKALIDGLKSAFNAIFDALRTVVKGIFEAAKALALAAIEAARVLIVTTIKAFGEVLKAAVSIAFAAFPEIAERINAKIDQAVDTAVEKVNQAAAVLKEGVAAALDMLANALDTLLGALQATFNALFSVIGAIIDGIFEVIRGIGGLVDSATAMPPNLEGAVWEQFIGVDLTKPLPGEEGGEMAMTAGQTTNQGSSGEERLTQDDVEVDPVLTEELEPELLADLNLAEGEERVIAESPGGIEEILADFEPEKNALVGEATQARDPAKETGRLDRAAQLWDQMKTLMGQWLSDNWGKLLLGITAALAGGIALTIATGGAILSAVPVLLQVISAIFAGIALVELAKHMKTYVTEGWVPKIPIAAKALASAVAIAIVEFAVVGKALKRFKPLASRAKAATKGVRSLAKTASSRIRNLLKSGQNLVSKSGKAMIRRGRLVFKGMKKGFGRGVQRIRDLAKKISTRFRFKKFSITKTKLWITLWGHFNPKVPLSVSPTKRTGRHSKQLSDDLIRTGNPRPRGYQAAHIVPTNNFTKRSPAIQKAIKSAQSKFDKFLSPELRDKAINGFWAEVGHAGTHTDRFFAELGKAFRTVNSEAAAKRALASLWKRIKAGEFA